MMYNEFQVPRYERYCCGENALPFWCDSVTAGMGYWAPVSIERLQAEHREALQFEAGLTEQEKADWAFLADEPWTPTPEDFEEYLIRQTAQGCIRPVQGETA